MSAISYDVAYPESRNRLTVAFRIILAIPHLVVAQVWGYLAQVLAVVQWFIIVFTGKRNQGIWNLQQSWLGYYGRVLGYVDLLFDEYPAFGTDTDGSPVRSSIVYEEDGDRLTTALRFLWVIPALIVGFVVGIAAGVLLLISWFAILFTGTQPRNMWEFILKVLRYTLQLEAYALLLTDQYPKFGDGAMATSASASPPPAPAGAAFIPPPPPVG